MNNRCFCCGDYTENLIICAECAATDEELASPHESLTGFEKACYRCGAELDPFSTDDATTGRCATRQAQVALAWIIYEEDTEGGNAYGY